MQTVKIGRDTDRLEGLGLSLRCSSIAREVAGIMATRLVHHGGSTALTRIRERRWPHSSCARGCSRCCWLRRVFHYGFIKRGYVLGVGCLEPVWKGADVVPRPPFRLGCLVQVAFIKPMIFMIGCLDDCDVSRYTLLGFLKELGALSEKSFQLIITTTGGTDEQLGEALRYSRKGPPTRSIALLERTASCVFINIWVPELYLGSIPHGP